MLAETPVRFNSVDHHARLDDNLGIDSTVGLGDKGGV